MSSKADAKTGVMQAPVILGVQYYIHYVPRKDWQKALDFFHETLGMNIKLDAGADGGWAELSGGGLTFALHSADKLDPHETGICFGVMDCDDAAKKLKARGVEGVTEPKSVSEEGRCFAFKDPFGYTFSCYGK